jgi:hypothetical protein
MIATNGTPRQDFNVIKEGLRLFRMSLTTGGRAPFVTFVFFVFFVPFVPFVSFVFFVCFVPIVRILYN